MEAGLRRVGALSCSERDEQQFDTLGLVVRAHATAEEYRVLVGVTSAATSPSVARARCIPSLSNTSNWALKFCPLRPRNAGASPSGPSKGGRKCKVLSHLQVPSLQRQSTPVGRAVASFGRAQAAWTQIVCGVVPPLMSPKKSSPCHLVLRNSAHFSRRRQLHRPGRANNNFERRRRRLLVVRQAVRRDLLLRALPTWPWWA